MRLVTLIALGAAFSTSLPAAAALISLDPGDFAPGTDMAAVDPRVHVYALEIEDAQAGLPDATGAMPVYAAPLAPGFLNEPLPETVTDASALGDQVFSTSPDSNPEWFGIEFSSPAALVFSFEAPVSSFSILSADIWNAFGNDPVMAIMFGQNGEYLGFEYENIIGDLGCFAEFDDFDICHALQSNELSPANPNVWSVAVLADSQPTTLGRATFELWDAPREVSEPHTLGLAVIGLGGILYWRMRGARKSLPLHAR